MSGKCNRSDPRVYSSHSDYGYGSRRGALLPLLGEGIFSQDGPPWKYSREILRKQFVKLHSQSLEGVGEHVENLLDCLSQSNGVVDLQPFFFRFTLDTTTALIFGQSVENLKNPDNDFAESFNLAQYIGAIRVRFSDFYWAYAPRRYLDACKLVKKYADHFIQEALAEKEEGNGYEAGSTRYQFIIDLFDELRDPILVRDQLVNVLLAGRDTTACLMSWTL